MRIVHIYLELDLNLVLNVTYIRFHCGNLFITRYNLQKNVDLPL